MNGLLEFLETSYTCYHAVKNAETFLSANGFTPLCENEKWNLREGGKYYAVRGGSIIAFTLDAGEGFKIVASHTDSPCLKLKENPAVQGEFTRLNAEPYGGGIWYTFFDRPLKIAGRIVTEKDGALTSSLYTGKETVVIPSLAVHMNRDVNEKFAPNLQTELPLYALGKEEFAPNAISYDLFVSCAEKPFESGKHGEFISSPRVDNLTSVYASLRALAQGAVKGVCVAACLEAEEIGSRTRGGAASDFLKNVLARISEAQGKSQEEHLRALASSFLISLDNAHSLHPNHPEKCDLTNRAVTGGGVVIKSHAGGAYTTDALSLAVVKKIFEGAGVKYQTFYNRSDMRSGSTLGAISLGQASILSADLGLAQLAMHSAVETFAKDDYSELEKGLNAFYRSGLCVRGETVTVK